LKFHISKVGYASTCPHLWMVNIYFGASIVQNFGNSCSSALKISRSAKNLNMTWRDLGNLGLWLFGTSALRDFFSLALQIFISSKLRVFVYFMGPLLLLNPTQFRHAECTKTVDLIGLMDLHCRFPQYEPKIDRFGLLCLSTRFSCSYKKGLVDLW